MIEFENLTDWHPADNDHCFLCGVNLHSENRTAEHVFPTWLQSRLNLWDKKLTLVNQTLLPYRQLKIPACRSCNGTHLSKLESDFQNIALDPSRELNDIPEWLVYLWCAKVFFGILYKEKELLRKRSDPSAGTIWPRSILDGFDLLHFSLQKVRHRLEFLGEQSETPGTVYSFNTKYNEQENFDLITSVNGAGLAVRIQNRGFVVVFDGGMQEMHKDTSPQIHSEHVLHPVQFIELAGHILYKEKRRCASFGYLLSQFDGDPPIFGMTQTGIRSENEMVYLPDGSLKVYEDFDPVIFGKYLSMLWRHWSIPDGAPEGHYISYIGEGEFPNIPLD